MSKVKYVYVSPLRYDGGVYQTQIIDWLKLYGQYGLDFELIQMFSLGYLRQGDYCKTQKQAIQKAAGANVCFYYTLPPAKILRKLNNWIFFRRMKKRLSGNEKLVVFSRADIGNEMAYMKQRLSGKVVYYYDLRGATVAERFHGVQLREAFSLLEYHKLADVAYSEYLCQHVADKIFVVSNALKQYFIANYHSSEEKFVLYPCLSSCKKFYYDEDLRERIRQQLNYNSQDVVFTYSGGIYNSYHNPDTFIRLFKRLKLLEVNAKLLILVKQSTPDFEEMVKNDILLKGCVTVKESVPNSEVVNYLNAADYGFLLRENITLNNVAYPSKFAEYMLCGLPTIITASLFDCSEYCTEHHSGYVLTNEVYEHIDDSDFTPLFSQQFDRRHIAIEAEKYLSKESQAERIVAQLKLE